MDEGDGEAGEVGDVVVKELSRFVHLVVKAPVTHLTGPKEEQGRKGRGRGRGGRSGRGRRKARGGERGGI